MNTLQQLQQARADLAALEADTGTLQGAASAQEATLTATRREARAGTAPFEAVVTAQTRHEAARGLLAQHLQDVADAQALVTELEAACTAADLLEEGRAAHRDMRELAQAHAKRAAQAEATLTAALEELGTLSQQHSRARTRLAAALRATVKAAQGSDPYGQGDRLSAPTDRDAGRAFLGEIDPALTEPTVLAPWGGELAVPEHRFPLLSRARGRG